MGNILMLFREKIPIDIFSKTDRLKKQLIAWVDASDVIQKVFTINYNEIETFF